MKRARSGSALLSLVAAGCARGGDAPSGSAACPPCPPCSSASASAPLPSASASAPAVARAAAPAVRSPFHDYDVTESESTEPMGYYATGLALADIDGDGAADLVIANGNDKGLQNLTVYANDGAGRFPKRPTWISDDLDSNGNVAVGDIDGDGGLDVAVSVVCGKSGLEDARGGRVKVYFSRVGPDGRRALEKRPSFETEDRFGSFGCALADVDGDGDLDLVAASLAEGDDQLSGNLRVYRNDRGKLSPRPTWTSEDRMAAGVPRAADVDGDGFLDLAVPAERVRVYKGGADAAGAVQIGRAPAWISADGSTSAPYLDVGPIGGDPRPALVVSYNDICYRSGAPCGSSRFRAYRLPATDPVWSSDDGGLGSGLVLADADRDGKLDLIAGRWGLSRDDGSPLAIYRGDDRAFSTAATYTSQTRSVVEAVAAGSLSRKLDALPVAEEPFAITRPQAVVTLSRQVIGAIKSIEKNDAALAPSEYATVPGQGWISFARRLAAGDRLKVRYAYVDAPDIAVANFFAQDKGSYVFLRGGK